MKISIKKTCISFLLLMMTLSGIGQNQCNPDTLWEDEKFFTMGYSLGLNVMSFRITPSEEFYAIDSLYPERGSPVPGNKYPFCCQFQAEPVF